jgi:FixJ family two-component response regulator
MERRLKLAGYEVATQRAFARHEVSCNLQEKLEPVRARIRKLTPRERQVFDLVIRGKQNKQIRGKMRRNPRHLVRAQQKQIIHQSPPNRKDFESHLKQI